MSLVLGVEILGEYKNLTAATKGAQSQLGALNQRAAKISAGINKAFAAIGIGFSLNMITRELGEAAKAAVEDNKAQILLAESMRKTIGATDAQIKSIEKYISKTELRTQILDDKLRPAMAIALRSTGDLTKAQGLLNLAVDVSVGTGKDLEIVTKSIARAYDGNYTGLQKLVPGISKGSDALDQLRAKFDGAAEAAAKTDPYMQMQVIFNDMQEQIGTALLPLLEDFSEWLSTPEGQAKLEEIVKGIKDIITQGVKLVQWVLDNKDWLVPMVAAIGGLTAAWNAATSAVQAYQALAGLGALVGGGAAAGGAIGAIGAGAAVGGFMEGQQRGVTSQIYGEGFKQLGSKQFQSKAQTTIINNIKGTQTAQQISATLNKQLKASGSSTIIRGGR